MIDEEGGYARVIEAIGTETDPVYAIERAVRQLRTQHERSGDIISAIRQGAEVDATLREVWDEGTRRYDDELRTVVRRLKALGALRTGVTNTEAVGLMSVLCSTETFTVLTTRHRWTPSQWETWTSASLRRLLLEVASKPHGSNPRSAGRTRRPPRP
jgi:hypothetical protein